MRMRTYQRSIDEGAWDRDRSRTVLLMPTAPYRVRPRFATAPRASKNDMGESRNGIAGLERKAKLRTWRASTTSSSAQAPRAAFSRIGYRRGGGGGGRCWGG